jgi:PAS domain S-box-containing protein
MTLDTMATPTTPLFEPPASREEGRNPAKRQQALLALGRRAMSCPGPLQLMQDAASLMAAMLGTEHWLVAEMVAEDELVLHLGILGRDGQPPETVVGRVPADRTRSLAGHALRAGQSPIVADLSRATHFEDRFLKEHGIGTALAIPLGLPHQPLGALAACSSNARSFADDDLVFAETIAQLVTTAVAWGRAEQTLAIQQRRSQGFLETVKAMVLLLDAEGRIVEANRTCQQLTGFKFEEIRGRHLWKAFPSAQELELFQTVFPQLLQEGNPVQYESCVLTKALEWRQIAWSCSVIRDNTGAIDAILATGIDLTEQRHAEAKLSERTMAADSVWPFADREEPSSFELPLGGTVASAKASPSTSTTREENSRAQAERRRRERRLYPYQQLIAPVFDGMLPRPNDFYHVLCHDISAGGFAFLSAEPTPFDSLVVALGTAPALTHLHAQIKHVTEVQYQGKRAFVVGCAYTGRVFY